MLLLPVAISVCTFSKLTILTMMYLQALLLYLVLFLFSSCHGHIRSYRPRDNELWSIPANQWVESLGDWRHTDIVTWNMEDWIHDASPQAGLHRRLIKERNVCTCKRFQRNHAAKRPEHEFYGYSKAGDVLHLLRRDENTVAGTIHSPGDGVTYSMYPDAEGTLSWVAKDTRSYVTEEIVVEPPPDIIEEIRRDQERHRKLVYVEEVIEGEEDEEADDSGVVKVDAMVLWTRQAECALARMDPVTCTLTNATESAMRALIDQAVAQTDIALKSSGVLMEYSLVHAYRVDYVEQSALVDLGHMSSKIDFVMDELHIIRKNVKADHVAMIISKANTCGNSYLGYPRTHPGLLFSVIPYYCAVEHFSFAHEFGHCNGCAHDRGNEDQCDDTSNTHYGYRSKVSPIRDLMATECTQNECDQSPHKKCRRVLQYSHPGDYEEGGKSLGPIGDDNNNCVAQMNKYRRIVSEASENLGYIPPPH
jgi:hypothetical protein